MYWKDSNTEMKTVIQQPTGSENKISELKLYILAVNCYFPHICLLLAVCGIYIFASSALSIIGDITGWLSEVGGHHRELTQYERDRSDEALKRR